MSSDRNIFVLFSPGLGGNHVANLLSTDKRYITRASAEDYKNHTEKNAHIVDNNLNNLNYANKETGNVFCGHFGEFYWKFLENKISKFANRQIILIELPANNSSLAFKRYEKYSKLTPYFIEEQRSLYTFHAIKEFFKEDDFFNINAEMIFDESIDSFLDYAKNEMNFELNCDECNKMHKIWIEKIKEYVEDERIS